MDPIILPGSAMTDELHVHYNIDDVDITVAALPVLGQGCTGYIIGWQFLSAAREHIDGGGLANQVITALGSLYGDIGWNRRGQHGELLNTVVAALIGWENGTYGETWRTPNASTTRHLLDGNYLTADGMDTTLPPSQTAVIQALGLTYGDYVSVGGDTELMLTVIVKALTHPDRDPLEIL